MKRSRAGAESMALRSYAMQQTRTLLRRLAFQIHRAGRAADAGAVHDLRVAIRRFAQCLRTFEAFYPHGQVRKIQRKLKTVMQTASHVRDRDITVELMRAARIAKGSRAVAAVEKERKQAERELVEAIRRTGKTNFSRKWRAKLGL
jgi:CHAD domain-containing protein